MDNVQLTSGSLRSIIADDSPDTSLWEGIHILQILSIRKIAPAREGSATDRYRLIISDGHHFTQAMLSTQLNSLVDEEQLCKHTIIKIEKLTCNVVQNKKLLILLNVSPVVHRDEKIGEPKNLESPGQQAASTGGITPSTDGSVGSAASTIANYQSTTQRGAAAAAQQPVAEAAAARPLGPNIYPIEGISPYTNKWTIRARITQKSEMRFYSSPKSGDGKMFTVTFMDESGEIRALAFNQVAEQFFDRLEEGKVYYVSKARCGVPKRKFAGSQQEFEITLETNSEIVECEDQQNAPKIRYNFVELAKLMERKPDEYCDVIAIVKNMSELSEIMSKRTNKQLQKRELTLVDRSDFEIRLTLWGKQAETFNVEEEAVMAFKSVRVGEFGGRSLSMTSGSSMEVNPDISEAHILRGWYDSKGKQIQFKTHAGTSGGGGGGFNRKEMKTVAEIKEAQARVNGEHVEYFSCKATITFIKSDSLYYTACKECNKKVTQVGNGWLCEKCDKSHDAPERRYILSMSVSDHTGQVWLHGFDEVGKIVFGMAADELNELKENNEPMYNMVLSRACCKTYNFACKSRQEVFNDQHRARTAILKIMPLDYKEEAWLLVKELQSASAH